VQSLLRDFDLQFCSSLVAARHTHLCVRVCLCEYVTVCVLMRACVCRDLLEQIEFVLHHVAQGREREVDKKRVL